LQTTFDHRDNNLDAIRMALALLVVFSHSYVLASGGILQEPLFVLSHGQEQLGEMAVELFFILSGFLVAASYERSSSLWEYLKKRIRRIYPAFVVAMAVSAFVILPAGGGHLLGATQASRLVSFALQTTRLHEFDYSGAFLRNPIPGVLNGSTWSIAYEFWCYLGVALLGITGLLRSSRVLLFLFLVAIALGVLFSFSPFVALFLRHWWNPTTVQLDHIFGYAPFWARMAPMYLSGIVFYRLRGHLSLKPLWILAGCAALVAATQLPHGWPLLFPVAGGYLALVLAFHPAVRVHRFGRFGDFSYGTYLYGYPVAQLVMQHVGHPVSPWKLFAVSGSLTVCCAMASWFLVERRFLHRAS